MSTIIIIMSSTTKEEDITLVIEQQNQKSLSSSLQSKFARAAVGASLALSLALSPTSAALAANGLPDEEVKVLCDAECVNL